ncbi:hypothetical protein RSOLAG1IB_07325 [Rhizoctonia solani AG-1 IB]|uniref:Zn(2)-C6 fungal-type domain-containing protein n=1 Tax=Thanatephorus cucumeris (strain AG1-IB / isolate 7/3/14) TaxID=1108050 RepID=A0A0B7F9P0_THACB|nr:hypothetical protein RSOLAG1IB_07325 [Rhizoctonia solani AG-1 IB]
MSPSQPRSRSGCSACRSKRKKCDETKPNCQRCENSGIQCPGYAFITCNPGGSRSKRSKDPCAVPASRRRNLSERTTLQAGASSSESSMDCPTPIWENRLENYSKLIMGSTDKLWCEVSSLATATQPPGDSLVVPNSFEQPVLSAPVDACGGDTNCVHQHHTSANHGTFQIETRPTASFALAIQAHDYCTTYRTPCDFGLQHVSTPAIGQPHNLNPSLCGARDSEDVKRVIFGSLVLDKNLKSNSLAFILESYAVWIQRTAYDPVRVARKSKDFIVKHYGDSAESRLTITLMANLVRGLAKSRSMTTAFTSVYCPIISALRTRLHRSMALFDPHQPRECRVLEATRVLDGILAHILAITGNLSTGVNLIEEAAPMVRQLCADFQGERLHLQRLLLHPTGVLRDYAVMDIFSSVTTTHTMTIQYDTAVDLELESSVLNFSDDAGIQWSRGIPDQITLIFARINALHGGSGWDSRTFDELEAMLENFVAIPTGSRETNLAVAQAVVQECWRQAAFIYLYMGLSVASAEDPRVMLALSNFTSSLNRIKPGRIPDSFIMLGLIIITTSRVPISKSSSRLSKTLYVMRRSLRTRLLSLIMGHPPVSLTRGRAPPVHPRRSAAAEFPNSPVF